MITPTPPEKLTAVGRPAVNILLVDDEIRNLDVLESILTAPDYRLHRAQTAQEALMALLDGEFAAIVLDIQMPGTTGFELAHLIKQRKKTQHIPIIFLTAYYQEDKDVLHGYEAGAVDFLTKPIDSRILKSKIAVFVELYQKNRELADLNRAMENEIVQRQKAEEALRQANSELEIRVQERTLELTRAELASRRLAAIVESSDDAIVSKDLHGVIISWNRGAERLFGYRAEEVIGQSVTILMPPERLSEEDMILQRIQRGEHLEDYETIRKCKDGTLIEISLAVSPIKDSIGKIVGASKIARSITRRKQVEREMAQARDEAVAASRAKDDFLAALSHELRTPLNPVLLLASQAAEDSQLPAEIRSQFATIRNGVELEARLIDDLLDITRITHDKLLLTMAPVEVHPLLQDAITTVRSQLNRKRITLKLDMVAKQSTVKGDAVRMQQVFWNILNNAAKFTPEGGTVTVETRTPPGTGELVITVTDTGIGLTSDESERIFEAFTQGEHIRAGQSHRFGGLGLGLAISRKLVELHSGTISASSDGRDRGATFRIILPLMPTTKRIPRSSQSNTSLRRASGKGRAILLVEDHEPTRTTLTHLLTRRHYEVKAAASLAEARALLQQHKFDLLISDIGLPDGTGFDLMSEVRAANKEIPGIALTGYGMEEDLARSRNAGFASHLVKPIRAQALEAALAAAAGQHYSGE